MKQKGVPVPREDFDDVIAKRPSQTYFDDILWATSRGKTSIVRKQKDIINTISNSPSVKKAVLDHIADPEFRQAYAGYTDLELTKVAEGLVTEYATELSAKMKKSVLRATAWATHKTLKMMFDKIIVDVTDLRKIKQLQEASRNPIVLVPTRKSYMDMILLNYVFFANGLKQPFSELPSHYQDVKLINRVFKNCGSFYVQEDNNKPLYDAILKEYISILISDKQTISVSIEDSREKSGMLGQSNTKVFHSVVNSYLSGKANEIDIIPVTINYDRILEGETFPYELVGEEKVKESLSRFISTTRYIGTPFGKVCVNFGKQISLRDYVESMGVPQHRVSTVDEDFKHEVTYQLSKELYESLSKNTVIMSTGPLATVLLEYRKGISNENLVNQVEYIYQELEARNALVAENLAANRGTTSAMVLLNEFVKKKRDVFEPFVSPKIDYKNILMLAYYRNTLVHVFLKEMIIGKS